jgi:hypothetical protein
MRSSRRVAAAALLLAGLQLVGARAASAQAWLPPKGEASFTLAWTDSWADHHLNYLGQSINPGDMAWNNVLSDLSYGITDRLAVRLNIPFVVSKYQGPSPHPPRPGAKAIDDGTWNSAFQDFRAEVRFRATTGSLAVTPMVALVVPSHSYEYLGHSAPGRDLVEGQFGVNVGRVLDPLLPNAYAQARYYYAVPEQPLGISHNRSNVILELGYFVTGSLTVSALGGWTHTHGGWRALIDFPPRTSPNFQYHDQLTKTEYFRLGGGVSYALTGSVDLGLNGFATLSAKNDVNMSAVTVSVTYSFSPAQIIKKNKGRTEPQGKR